MADLLPCPFCGTRPTLMNCEKGPFIYGAFVQCDGCAASQSIAPTADKAVAAWNRRAPPAGDAPTTTTTTKE